MKKHYYVITVQFLGYRFHGWQKQPHVKTVHLMIDKTLKFILEKKRFKTLGSGRTDAMVSAQEAAFELFLEEPIHDFENFMEVFNQNLPQDIRALKIKEVDQGFNIIQHSKIKEYLYLFSQGTKNHPFCAPIMTTILEPLDIELMKQGAKCFEGYHNFKTYAFRATNEGIYNRTLDTCVLFENNLFSANFFPDKSYILKVKGKGFMRNQIRLMMGALICLGRNEIDLEGIKRLLNSDLDDFIPYVAAGSGLHLKELLFDHSLII